MASSSAQLAAIDDPPSRSSSHASKEDAGRSPSLRTSAGAGSDVSGVRATYGMWPQVPAGYNRGPTFSGAVSPPPATRSIEPEGTGRFWQSDGDLPLNGTRPAPPRVAVPEPAWKS